MTTRTRPQHRHTRLRGRIIESDMFAFALAALVAVGFGNVFLRDPPRVDSVSLHNPTGYDIAVQVSGEDSGWLPLSTARRHDTKTVEGVIDQGDTWTFRFRAQGRPGGEIRLDRDQLEATGWVVEIPPAVEDHLRDAGAPPPP